MIFILTAHRRTAYRPQIFIRLPAPLGVVSFVKYL